MGSFGELFSGSSGMGWEPERAASAQQAQQQYQQAQDALQRQREFTQAIMGQLPGALAGQQQVSNLYQQQLAGVAPSVAQKQLAQTTGENVAQTAALMASKRGASANAGLVGRQAGMAGMEAQQRAAGQAATLRAQEQLAAQAGMQGLTQNQIAAMQQAQGMGIQGQLQEQQNVLNAIASANAAKAGVAQQTAKGQGDFYGGIMKGISAGAAGAAHGGVAGKDFGAKHFASGGGIGSDEYWEHLKSNLGNPRYMGTLEGSSALSEGAEGIGKAASKKLTEPSVSGETKGGYAGANLGVDTTMPQMTNPMATSESIGAYKLPFAHGGEVPAMLSPGEKYLPPREVEKVAKGQKPVEKAGKMIPGRAKVDGDSLKNDTVHARLEEGGIVIPRSVMQSKDPGEQSRKFVEAVLARQRMKRK
jgi:hypothetical protein